MQNLHDLGKVAHKMVRTLWNLSMDKDAKLDRLIKENA